MRNGEIEYETSTDYKLLYDLLKEGKTIIGFLDYDFKINQLSLFKFSNDMFFFGYIAWAKDNEEITFNEFCRGFNVRFLPIKITEKRRETKPLSITELRINDLVKLNYEDYHKLEEDEPLMDEDNVWFVKSINEDGDISILNEAENLFEYVTIDDIEVIK